MLIISSIFLRYFKILYICEHVKVKLNFKEFFLNAVGNKQYEEKILAEYLVQD